MQLRFEPAQDRLLWQLRTTDGALYAVWLTRRMVRLMWPHLARLVTQAELAQELPHAHVVPEAQPMLAQAMRDRPLRGASFDQPFAQQAASRPQGDVPLLPEAIDLGPGDGGKGLRIQLRESVDPASATGRRLAVQLNADLATALQRLLEQALAGADWNLPVAPPATDAASAPRPPVLN